MQPEFRAPTPADDLGDLAVDPGWRAANPEGAPALAAFVDGRAVAHAALVPLRVWAAAKERRFAALTDVFERPGAPAGSLVLTLRGLLEEHHGPRAATVVFGWPDGTTAKVLERMLGFETIRTEVVLVCDLQADLAPDGVEPLARFDEQARWLFDRCAGGFGASAVRDDEYLNWRFVDRPDRSYQRLGVRDEQGVLRGYAILAGGLRGDDLARVADWLVPPDEPEVGERLVRAARAAAAARGARRLELSLPPWSPWFDAFQTWGFRVEPARRFLLASSSVRKLDDLWLRDHWWYTDADGALV